MTRARIGDLTERVTFQEEVRVGDGGGGYSTTWQDVVTVWAEVRPLSGRERLHAEQLEATADYRVVIRSRAGLDEAMRVIWPGHPEPGQIRFLGRARSREQFMMIDVEFGVAT